MSAAKPSILFPFKTFAYEGAAVGRLLAGYSTLEVGLLHCVQMGLGDFDTVFKAMFRHRGERRRIDEAKKLGRPAYVRLALEAEFQTAIAAMLHCLNIRNQYAHWVWWDDNTGRLAFGNLEDLAKEKAPVKNFHQLGVHHVDAALLDDQEAYFVYADRCLAWVNYEGQFRSGKLQRRVPQPQPVAPPMLKL